MESNRFISLWAKARTKGTPYITIWQILHLDFPVFSTFIVLAAIGLVILYSASNQNLAMVDRQALRLLMAFGVMIAFAQIPPQRYRFWAPYFFVASLALLIAVLMMGHIGKGAQRWLTLGVVRIQPSELLKLSLPMMLAYYLHDKALPPTRKQVMNVLLFILIPVIIVAKQPDLGTAIIIASAGMSVLFLANIRWRWILTSLALSLIAMPIVWKFMHGYQRARVLTFLNPERDPLGKSYHIIQSKIAMGSGGLVGKGWLNGSQSHLKFLPEHATDFIFAVCGEEFGLLGCLTILFLYFFIVSRCLYLSAQAGDTFSRLLGGSLAFTFFISFFVNAGMVTGMLPVVGLPLPLVSYGGTSMISMFAGFGVLMSIATHRKLIST